MSIHPRIASKGWIPDLPDIRDVMFDLNLGAVDRPSAADLTSGMPPVYDQSQIGSCTANAIAAAVQYVEIRERKPDASSVPSRLFVYYNERVMEGDPGQDGGAMIRDGMKSVATLGVCGEDVWPYDITKFAEYPGADAYAAAADRKILSYRRVAQTVMGIEAAIASGYPVVFGFSVYESFESDEVARTGEVPMPAKGESMIGGHAVLMVGYDHTTGRAKCRNSWGPGWGQAGYFTMPYGYVLNRQLASDFWIAKLAE